MENKMIEIKINRWDKKQIFGRITKQDYISFFPKQNVPLKRISGGSRCIIIRSPSSHLPSALDLSSSLLPGTVGQAAGTVSFLKAGAHKLSLGH